MRKKQESGNYQGLIVPVNEEKARERELSRAHSARERGKSKRAGTIKGS
ncbi:hypothetical protein [Neobacillus niacini]|nr:hypothetical protein [Neobacillus niacini]MDR6998719.1 hypothetical protein [Neobacillus niacini]